MDLMPWMQQQGMLPAAGEFRRVKVNGRTVKPAFDGQLRCPVVEVPSTDIRKEVKIEIFG
jgi:hypothetical protein